MSNIFERLHPWPSFGLFRYLFQKVHNILKIFRFRLTFKKILPSVVCGCKIQTLHRFRIQISLSPPPRYVGGSLFFWLWFISEVVRVSTSNFCILLSIQIFSNNNKINLPFCISCKSFYSRFIDYNLFVPFLNFNKKIIRCINLCFLLGFARTNCLKKIKLT